MPQIPNNIAVITGTTSGIGEQTAYQFARAGWNLGLSFHAKPRDGERVAKQCLELGAAQALAWPLDLADDGSIEYFTDQIKNNYAQIDILINNAGILNAGELATQSFSEISKTLRTNLEGPIKLTSKILPIVKSGIINIGSQLSLTGKRRFAAYSASKFGIRGFGKSLANEYPNLKVFTVIPGLTATGLVNWVGRSPDQVAQIIFDLAIGKYKLPSGSDVSVNDYFSNPLKRILKKILRRR